MLMIDMEMPESCDICPFRKINDDLMSDDYRYMYCDYPYMGEYVSNYIASRHPDCPLKEVVQCRQIHDREIQEHALEQGIDAAIRLSNHHRAISRRRKKR